MSTDELDSSAASSPTRRRAPQAKVLLYAEFLGVDLARHPYLYDLMEEGLRCPIPAGWDIRRLEPDEDGTARVEFFHAATGQVSSAHPMDNVFLERARALVRKHGDSDADFGSGGIFSPQPATPVRTRGRTQQESMGRQARRQNQDQEAQQGTGAAAGGGAAAAEPEGKFPWTQLLETSGDDDDGGNNANRNNQKNKNGNKKRNPYARNNDKSKSIRGKQFRFILYCLAIAVMLHVMTYRGVFSLIMNSASAQQQQQQQQQQSGADAAAKAVGRNADKGAGGDEDGETADV